MERLLNSVLSLSYSGSLAILAVLAARLLLKKQPKILSYALWAVVLVRLVCPMSFSSPYYGVPPKSAVPIFSFAENTTAIHAVSPGVVPAQPQIHDASPFSPMFILSLIWALGVVAMIVYGLCSYIKLKQKLVGAVRYEENIYLVDYLETPFVLGIVRPKIYLPSDIESKEMPYILAHEQHHIRRLDYLTKPLGFLTLCLHWFNPLVWLAFLLFCKDMEMSCDEAVIQKLGERVRADYSAALLSLATGRSIIAGMPLAFGEGDTKGRIQNMKNWKKPVLWTVIIAVVGCMLLAAFLLTDRKEDISPEQPAENSQQLLDTLVDSIHYENQNIVFTIPEDEKKPEKWVILISGRAEYPDGMSMSKHYLEETAWEAGKNYSVDVSDADLTELHMYISYQETGKDIDLMEYLPRVQQVHPGR